MKRNNRLEILKGLQRQVKGGWIKELYCNDYIIEIVSQANLKDLVNQIAKSIELNNGLKCLSYENKVVIKHRKTILVVTFKLYQKEIFLDIDDCISNVLQRYNDFDLNFVEIHKERLKELGKYEHYKEKQRKEVK